MGDENRIIIFDTTLRDGEQALKVSLSKESKLQVARTLERLGVDYIEAGFPVSSPGDFDSVQSIARDIKESRVCGLARAVRADIDACGKALKVADQFRIHTFIATSPLHIKHKLRQTFDQTLAVAVDSVRRARQYTDDVEFSCEDAGRTPLEDLYRFVEEAIRAGATTINIPDTVGYTLPQEFSGIISGLINNVPNIDKAVLSVHCHDDLGLSVANSIMAIQAGARQVEGTINGLGERAGNCALEEVAMILHTRRDMLGYHCGMKLNEIHRASHHIAQRCNVPVQPNKAIVGENAFAHSSGIHQDGVLKEQTTYEIITPETIGLNSNQLNLTSRSGRHVIKYRLEQLGYKEGKDFDLDQFYDKFLKLADRKGAVYDYDLEAILWLEAPSEEGYQLDYLSVTSGSGTISTATIRLQTPGGESFLSDSAIGNGPVDAVYNAIDSVSGRKLRVMEYKISSRGQGRDAIGQVDIVAGWENGTYHGVGVSTDIVEASALAYLNVLNCVQEADKVVQKSGEGERASAINRI